MAAMFSTATLSGQRRLTAQQPLIIHSDPEGDRDAFIAKLQVDFPQQSDGVTFPFKLSDYFDQDTIDRQGEHFLDTVLVSMAAEKSQRMHVYMENLKSSKSNVPSELRRDMTGIFRDGLASPDSNFQHDQPFRYGHNADSHFAPYDVQASNFMPPPMAYHTSMECSGHDLSAMSFDHVYPGPLNQPRFALPHYSNANAEFEGIHLSPMMASQCYPSEAYHDRMDVPSENLWSAPYRQDEASLNYHSDFNQTISYGPRFPTSPSSRIVCQETHYNVRSTRGSARYQQIEERYPSQPTDQGIRTVMNNQRMRCFDSAPTYSVQLQDQKSSGANLQSMSSAKTGNDKERNSSVHTERSKEKQNPQCSSMSSEGGKSVPEPEDHIGKKICVRGIPLSVDYTRLWQIFANFGKIHELKMIPPPELPSKYAFIQYNKRKHAATAIKAMTGRHIGKPEECCTLDVSYAYSDQVAAERRNFKNRNKINAQHAEILKETPKGAIPGTSSSAPVNRKGTPVSHFSLLSNITSGTQKSAANYQRSTGPDISPSNPKNVRGATQKRELVNMGNTNVTSKADNQPHRPTEEMALRTIPTLTHSYRKTKRGKQPSKATNMSREHHTNQGNHVIQPINGINPGPYATYGHPNAMFRTGPNGYDPAIQQYGNHSMPLQDIKNTYNLSARQPQYGNRNEGDYRGTGRGNPNIARGMFQGQAMVLRNKYGSFNSINGFERRGNVQGYEHPRNQPATPFPGDPDSISEPKICLPYTINTSKHPVSIEQIQNSQKLMNTHENSKGSSEPPLLDSQQKQNECTDSVKSKDSYDCATQSIDGYNTRLPQIGGSNETHSRNLSPNTPTGGSQLQSSKSSQVPSETPFNEFDQGVIDDTTPPREPTNPTWSQIVAGTHTANTASSASESHIRKGSLGESPWALGGASPNSRNNRWEVEEGYLAEMTGHNPKL